MDLCEIRALLSATIAEASQGRSSHAVVSYCIIPGYRFILYHISTVYSLS